MRKSLFVAAALAALGAVYVGLSYHIVTGSTVSGVSLQKKPSLTFSETFVNMDSVGNMPLIAARSQYPMFVSSMERGVAALHRELSKSCSDVAVGMYRSQVLDLCGRPDHTDSVADGEEVMHWSGGLMVKVKDGRTAFVSGH